jgi:hypothetical protein
MPEPGFLAIGTRADGVVRVASHKSDHLPMPGAVDGGPFYRKLAYSTHTGPELGDAGEDDLDAQVALVSADGTRSRRGRIHCTGVVDRVAISVHYPGEHTVAGGRHLPLWLERVETAALAWRGAEIRLHHAASFGARRLRDAGFALAGPEPPEAETGPGGCVVRRGDGLLSAIFGLHGFGAAEVRRHDGSNAFGRHSATPFLLSPGEIPVEGVFASLVFLGRAVAAPFDGAARPGPLPRVVVDGRRVEVACPDGERFFVQLVAPEPVEAPLDDPALSGPLRYARRSPDGAGFAWREPS